MFCYSARMKYALITLAVLMTALPAAADTFKGYTCTKDCSGHKAGYAWAQKKGITDPSTCSGHSKSFIQGCRAAAEEAFDPSAIEPAAGAEDAIDPSTAHDPFALQPFSDDPFSPGALPGMGH